MAYFPDLTPYAYGHHAHPGAVHVGWLDGVHEFPTRSVDPAIVEKLRLLTRTPVELYRGYHHCELCKEPPTGVSKIFLPGKPTTIDPDCAWSRWCNERRSNGEIRVQGRGVIYTRRRF